MNKILEEKIKNVILEIPDFPKAGINFKDISPLLRNAELGNEILIELENYVSNLEIDAIAGIESRGYLYSHALALKLNLPFILIRKAGKLPGELFQEEYELEYGSAILEIKKNALKKGERVFLYDDLLASGGTMEAASKLIVKTGACIGGIGCLVNLTFLNGFDRINKYSKNFINFANYNY